MRKAINYINETLGTNALENSIQNKDLGNLPMYITQAYKLYATELFNRELIMIELKSENELSLLQVDKHLQLLKTAFNKIVVLVLENLPAYNRKRLIERGINFIVPNKQLYLPELLINLSENYSHPKTKQKNKNLMPSSQFLLLYHIIHGNNNWNIEEHSFKEIAKKLDYTPMAVSYAVEDLMQNELIEVSGEKEKYIKFKFERKELWRRAEEQNLLTSPVLKTVYVDDLPSNVSMLRTNASALPEYTSLNPSKQNYFAIEKSSFYFLQKNNGLINANNREGKYAIEVWKYNPITLADEMPNHQSVVDPLSLYLSLKDNHDERVEMALEQIIEKQVW
ncbi:helix-turn-helix domain-containing protein [Lutibacter sp.]|uniref:MarR family transcriptional regulator n=1 Tax=Lutibacter sp. TaxID=1925666 RepID=UPI002732D2C7|nr:helix-turn-helix domain-containing protein [Lutibacter sp.]MDP3312321.1 helix-turn-helix domain-containing protein [Lutibacter sp.]